MEKIHFRFLLLFARPACPFFRSVSLSFSLLHFIYLLLLTDIGDIFVGCVCTAWSVNRWVRPNNTNSNAPMRPIRPYVRSSKLKESISTASYYFMENYLFTFSPEGKQKKRNERNTRMNKTNCCAVCLWVFECTHYITEYTRCVQSEMFCFVEEQKPEEKKIESFGCCCAVLSRV